MKNLHILLALLLTKAIVAQQPFTNANCFSLNDSATINAIVVMQNYDDYLTLTGNNYNWNFSANGIPGPWGEWTKPTASYQFRSGAESGSAVFAASEINEFGNAAFQRNQFFTYSTNKDILYLDGFVSSSINYARTPSVPYLSFPLNFGDSVYTTTKQYGIPSQPTRETGSVTRYWIYEGFGSLSFPFQTINNNVYKIRTKQIDSTYITSMATVYDEMIWFDGATGIPVLRFLKNGTFITAWYAHVSGGSTTSVVNQTEGQEGISIYLNPVSNQLSIQLNNNAQVKAITAIDVTGKVFKIEPTGDVSHLNNGMYLIQVELTNGKSLVKRVLVQH